VSALTALIRRAGTGRKPPRSTPFEIVKHFILDQALASQADQLGAVGGDSGQDEVEMSVERNG
jgi:hypothetical protein